MHAFDSPTTQGVTYFHNGDFSGNVKILVPTDMADVEPVENTDFIEIEVPFEDLKALVARYVRRRKIADFEREEDDVILGISHLEEL